MHKRYWQLGIALAALLWLAAAAPTAAQDDANVAKKTAELDKAAAAEGDDLAIDAPESLGEALWALWKKVYGLGGNTMIALAAMSIIGLASILERIIGLLAAAFSVSGPVEQAGRLWRQNRFGEVEDLARRSRGITARLIGFVASHREYRREDVSDGVSALAGRYMKRHARRNYWLPMVAVVSPLLGLYGTIIGMIEAFQKVNIAGSMGSAEYLSGAISKALVTTAGGLMIAIPALLAYHIFKFLTGVLADTLEGQANQMVTGWLMRKEAA